LPALTHPLGYKTGYAPQNGIFRLMNAGLWITPSCHSGVKSDDGGQ
jgi:hypothetical protein